MDNDRKTICILSETSEGTDVFNALRAYTPHNLVFCVYRNFEYNRLPHADLFLVVSDTIEHALALKVHVFRRARRNCVLFVWDTSVAGDVSIFVGGRDILSKPQKIKGFMSSLEAHMGVSGEVTDVE